MTEEKKDGQENASASGVTGESDLSEENKQILADMRAQHGKKIAFWYDEDFGLVVIAKPRGTIGEANYNRLVGELHDPDVDKAVALKTYALSCVVYPSRDEAKKIFQDNGPFALLVAGRAQRLGGAQVKELGKA
jgi:hypothetical protein